MTRKFPRQSTRKEARRKARETTIMPDTMRAPATVITRRQPPVAYLAGQKQVVQLSRNLPMRGIGLRLTATPTLTGVNNTVANTALGDEWNAVTKAELFVNGGTPIFSVPGSALKTLSRLWH